MTAVAGRPGVRLMPTAKETRLAGAPQARKDRQEATYFVGPGCSGSVTAVTELSGQAGVRR